MEHLEFSYHSATSPLAGEKPALAGVVGSGNLEVLVEAGELGAAQFVIDTSATGFRCTWEAVLNDFATRFPVGGLRFSINDNAATPSVVSLRLRQVLETLEGVQS